MLAVAYQGCACRAAFHAGVTASLVAAGLPIAMTAGASSGSLCAAAVAAGRGADLPTLFLGLGGRSVVSLRRALWNRSPFDMSHLVSTTLRQALGAADLRREPCEALVIATRARDLARRVYSSRTEPDLVAALLGSCFLPVLYGRPVRLRGELLVDGGLRDNLPVELCAGRGAREVIAVVTGPDGTALKTPLRPRWRPEAPGARVHVIHPSAPLAIRSWDLDRRRLQAAIDDGRRQGDAFLERYRRADQVKVAI